jgi:hypothetical protein
MRPSNAVYFLAAGMANAALQLVPNAGSMAMGGLFARQLGECTIRSTCAQCFGDGYVVCDTIGCFNPDKFQQCCSGARKWTWNSNSTPHQKGEVLIHDCRALRGPNQQLLQRLGELPPGQVQRAGCGPLMLNGYRVFREDQE